MTYTPEQSGRSPGRRLQTLALILSLCALFVAGFYAREFWRLYHQDNAPEMPLDVAPIVDKAGPAVVAISISQPTGLPNISTEAAGSGFIIDPSGYILTNEHVIHEAESIIVTLADERRYPAEVIAADVRSDIAMIKIEADNLPVLPLAQPGELKVGQPVIALGNPLGTGADGKAVATFGRVNRLGQTLHSPMDNQDRFYDNLIQTDAVVLPGNSGGPLIDIEGRALGINTAMATGLRGRQFGFAIELDQQTVERIDALREGELPGYAFLGVNLREVDTAAGEALGLDDISGALVDTVLLGTPAQEVGLRSGDVIKAVDGRPVHSPDALISAINDLRPGTTVTLEVVRGGDRQRTRTKQFRVELIGRNREDLLGWQREQRLDYLEAWGMTLKPLTDWRRGKLGLPAWQEGVLVYAVQPGSPAEQRGIEAGDVIIGVGNYRVDNLTDFALNAEDARRMPEIELWRDVPTRTPVDNEL